MGELLAALQEVDLGVVFTFPNADTGGHLIADMIHQFAAGRERSHVVTNLGTQGYFSLMNEAMAMVGNSSSGIIEAASFKLPVVNIGNRQKGRLHEKNVINVGYSRQEIKDGVRSAVSSEFRASLANLNNPYGDGHAADKIVDKLKHVSIDTQLLSKRFYTAQ